MAKHEYKLDEEEQEIINAYERGELKSVNNVEEEIASFRRAAKALGNKDKRVSIRMTSWDYRKAHEKALEEGLGYQTLLSSILHKYFTGKLVERRS